MISEHLEPAQLKPMLREQIDQMDETSLLLAQRALLLVRKDQLLRELAVMGAGDRKAGKLEPAAIDAAIREFRRDHPYR